MTFATPLFLFKFLPLVLLVYYIVNPRLRNVFLLATSLFFYTWAGMQASLIMLGSITGNYVLGLCVDGRRGTLTGKLVVAAAVVFNLALLGWFKYANFFVENYNGVATAIGLPAATLARVLLPAGISFFTFQALSYVIDVYRGEGKVQKNPLNIALYVSFFPQLIAGPIVRFQDFVDQIDNRPFRLAELSYGVRRFLIGLGKKVLIANTLAVPVDAIFGLPNQELTVSIAWLAMLCYALQIYFDFSGYSDMAIGLGHLFGFHFVENFRDPYASRSVTEFWRRWHITLSTWYRDYLYIPLGGNRGSPARTYFNLLVVFALCGFWHGASWNFVIWGMLHGSFLILERMGSRKWTERLPAFAAHAYTLTVVLVSYVFFRANTLNQALAFLTTMFTGGSEAEATRSVWNYLDSQVACMLIVGSICSVPFWVPVKQWLGQLRSRLGESGAAMYEFAVQGVSLAGGAAVLFLASASLASGTYNPFIYFRF